MNRGFFARTGLLFGSCVPSFGYGAPAGDSEVAPPVAPQEEVSRRPPRALPDTRRAGRALVYKPGAKKKRG